MEVAMVTDVEAVDLMRQQCIKPGRQGVALRQQLLRRADDRLP